MKVFIPTPLRSYTENKGELTGDGATLGELLANLDQRFPGFRFRIIHEQEGIREHIKIFVNQDLASDLKLPLRPNAEVHIICALSGGVESKSEERGAKSEGRRAKGEERRENGVRGRERLRPARGERRKRERVGREG